MSVTITDFAIEQKQDENYVVKAKGIYQDIDFVNGGYIKTEARAQEIRDLMIEQMNAPPAPIPKPDGQRIADLEAMVNNLQTAAAAQLGV